MAVASGAALLMVQRMVKQFLTVSAAVGGLLLLWVAYQEALSQFGYTAGRGYDVMTFSIAIAGVMVLIGAWNASGAPWPDQRLVAIGVILIGGLVGIYLADSFHAGKSTAAHSGGVIALGSGLLLILGSALAARNGRSTATT